MEMTVFAEYPDFPLALPPGTRPKSAGCEVERVEINADSMLVPA